MEQYTALASLYDGFMDDVDYQKWSAYIAALMKECSVRPGGTILECGCGTGSITIPLKKAGFNITGTDISDEMLAFAQEKARNAGVFIPFARMDMRRLAFHRPVDCVLACCDCVNYLTADEDAADFFRAAHAVLRPGGALLFDISSRCKLERILGGNSFCDSRADRAYFWRNNYDGETKLIEMELEFFTKTANGLYERKKERHIQRAWSEKELREKLEEAGFGEIRTYGAFSFCPAGESEERIQFTAVKRG